MAQGCTASEGQSWHLNRGLLSLGSTLSPQTCTKRRVTSLLPWGAHLTSTVPLGCGVVTSI